MPILKPLTEYSAPTLKQRRVIAKLLSVDVELVSVIVPTQKLAKPLIKLSEDVSNFKSIKKHVDEKGFDINWLKLKIGNSMVVGKARWNKLVEYLTIKKSNYIIEEFATEDVFKNWFNHLDMINNKFLKSKDADFSFLIAHLLFPLLESISFSLFNKPVRVFLKQELGIKKPDLLIKVFRHGYLHNMMPNKLEYSNGSVGWAVSSTSHNVDRPFFNGYKSKNYPEDNMEAEEEFYYKIFKGNLGQVSLSLDRLHAHIKSYLETRKEKETRQKLEVVVGLKIDNSRPTSK